MFIINCNRFEHLFCAITQGHPRLPTTTHEQSSCYLPHSRPSTTNHDFAASTHDRSSLPMTIHNLVVVAGIHDHQELTLTTIDNRSISTEKLLYVTLFDLIETFKVSSLFINQTKFRTCYFSFYALFMSWSYFIVFTLTSRKISHLQVYKNSLKRI